jgi:endonuclease/exonuclease/phosphatase family metal-dependent hydrolase
MAGFVDRFRPDVLLLQEADGPALEASESVADLPHRVLRPDAGYAPGIAILSRYPVQDSGALAEATDPGARPRLIWARLAVGPDLVVGSLHAAAPIGDPRFDNPRRRAVHLRSVSAFARQLAHSAIPAVVGGDCNTVRFAIPGYADAATAEAAGRATWRPIGGMPWLPAIARLDRLFVSSQFAVLETTTPCSLSRSDHCPVVTRLRLVPAASPGDIT